MLCSEGGQKFAQDIPSSLLVPDVTSLTVSAGVKAKGVIDLAATPAPLAVRPRWTLASCRGARWRGGLATGVRAQGGWRDCLPSGLPGRTGAADGCGRLGPTAGRVLGLEEAEAGRVPRRGPWDFLSFRDGGTSSVGAVRPGSRWPHVPAGLLNCGSCGGGTNLVLFFSPYFKFNFE